MDTSSIGNEIPISFGEWVQNRRVSLDLTRNGLAAIVGCSPVTIKKIERDERRPSRQIAQLLAEHLNIPSDQVDAFIRKGRGEHVEIIRAVGDHKEPEYEVPEDGYPLYNLPEPTTRFIGRRAEVDALEQLIMGEGKNLVTITGVGGMGKTRLALQVTQTLIETDPLLFPDGVYFVDLTAQTHPRHLPASIADAVFLTFSKGANETRLPKEQLLDFLKNKEMLLILDHFDHLIDGAGLILEILQVAPELNMLITSGERLSLQEEQNFPIQGLPFPADDNMIDSGEYPAIELFIESARRIQPDFQLSHENIRPIAKLCQLVDGMPLGIELAAVWVDMLSPGEIATEIESSVDFLSTDVRNFPERHRRIRALFDTIWDRLSEKERWLLPKLSVFQGGFSRQAVREIFNISIRILGKLVDRSLIRYNATTGLYQQNELLRQYGAEKLAQPGQDQTPDEIADRHSHYYLNAIARRLPLLKGDGQQEALQEIDEDLKNVRKAWNRAIHNQDIDLLRDSVDSLGNFLDLQGRYVEGNNKFQALITRLESTPSIIETHADVFFLLIRAKLWQSSFCLALGYDEDAHSSLNEIFESKLFGSENESESDFATWDNQAFALYMMGHLKSQEDILGSKPFYQRALDLSRKLEHSWEEGMVLAALGRINRTEGNYDIAGQLLHDSLVIRQSLGDRIGAVETLGALSELARSRGQFFEAKQLAQSAVDISRKINNRGALAHSLANLGMSAYFLGQFDQQHMALIESVALYEDLGNSRRLADTYFNLSMSCTALGNFEDARQNIQRGLTLARQSSNRLEEAMLLYSQGMTMAAGSHFDSGKQMLLDSLSIFPSPQPIGEKNAVKALLGMTEFHLGNPTPAKHILAECLTTAVWLQDTLSLLHTLGYIARILVEMGDPEKERRAVEIWKIIERQSPPFQKAVHLRTLYGDRLTDLETRLSSVVRLEIEEKVQRHTLWDEANALVEAINVWEWHKKSLSSQNLVS